jgi:hypothetical protein
MKPEIHCECFTTITSVSITVKYKGITYDGEFIPDDDNPEMCWEIQPPDDITAEIDEAIDSAMNGEEDDYDHYTKPGWEKY